MKKGESRRSILIALRRREAMTIDELVKEVGLSKTATRAHLIRMERGEIVERVSYQSEGPGRSPAAFSLTERGAQMLPSDDGAVLSKLIRFLENNGAEKLVEAFFTELWAERMNEFLDALGTGSQDALSLDMRLAAIEDTLTKSQFMPVIDRRQSTDGTEVVCIRECNCPLPAAARASRIPCRLEIEFLSTALGAQLRTCSIASERKGVCTFEFNLS